MVSVHLRLLSVGLTAAIAASICFAEGLPRAIPGDVGMSADRLDYLDRFYEGKVRAGEMAGIVTLIARHGKVVHFSAVGYSDLEKRRRMETSTIFRLYSMTKPITSVVLMMLYQNGLFEMNDPDRKSVV